MIKTGAHRVHPQDVEEVIAELPGVREVAVTGVDDALLGQVVAAFLVRDGDVPNETRSEEHTSELQSLMRISYAVICLKKKIKYMHTVKRTCNTDYYKRQ